MMIQVPLLVVASADVAEIKNSQFHSVKALEE
jgi:hypothetical protein